MKFLMFSLVVAGALIYLFSADKAETALKDDPQDQVFKEMIAEADAATAKAKIALKSKAPVPADPSVVSASPATVSTPQVAAVVAEQPMPQQLTPEVAKRREEILNSAPSVAKENFKIVEDTDRQERLRELSEDMELFSAQMSSQ